MKNQIKIAAIISCILALTLAFSLATSTYAAPAPQNCAPGTHTWGNPEPWKPAPELFPLIWMVYCQTSGCTAETRHEHLQQNCDNGQSRLRVKFGSTKESLLTDSTE